MNPPIMGISSANFPFVLLHKTWDDFNLGQGATARGKTKISLRYIIQTEMEAVSSNNFDKEIERILEYPREVSTKVVKENKEDIITCLKYYNAFDDWGHELPFLGRASDKRPLRTWEVFLEADINMETALIQSIHGLYKSSLMSLRSCFENAFLMVFYSYPEKDKEYDDFWDGKIDTPSFREIRSYLFAKKEFQAFDTKYDLHKNVKAEYRALSSYIHTRGYERFESHFRTPREKRTRVFGDYLGFDPNFMKEIASHLSRILEIASVVFALRFHGISRFFKKPELIHDRLRNIIITLPEQRVEQLLDYYLVNSTNFWKSFKKP